MSEYKSVREWPELMLELFNAGDERLYIPEPYIVQEAPGRRVVYQQQQTPTERRKELDQLRERVSTSAILKIIATAPVIEAKQFFAAAMALRRRRVNNINALNSESSRDQRFLGAVLETLHFLYWDALTQVDDIDDYETTCTFAVDEPNRDAGTEIPLRGLVVGKIKRASPTAGAPAIFSVYLVRARNVYPPEEDLDVFTLEAQPPALNPLRNGSRNAISTVSLTRSNGGVAVPPLVPDRPRSEMTIDEASAYSTLDAHDVLVIDSAMLIFDLVESARNLGSIRSVGVSRFGDWQRRVVLASLTRTVVAQLASTSTTTTADAIQAILFVTRYFIDLARTEPRRTITQKQLRFSAPGELAIASVIAAVTQITHKIHVAQREQGAIDLAMRVPASRYSQNWPYALLEFFLFRSFLRLRTRIVRTVAQLFPKFYWFIAQPEKIYGDRFYKQFLPFLDERDTGFDYDPDALF